MASLYPTIEPYETGFLEPSDGHSIFYEVSGNPAGEPIVFLHGGPGSGCTPDARRFFDPRRFKIVLFDQRGCGKSKPHGRLEHNTTGHLVSDMERLRAHLGLRAWHVFGGSWGSTLALAYGVEHPTRAWSLTLYGVFLARESELQAFYAPGGLAHQLFPDEFEEYIALLPETDWDRPIAGYKSLFEDPDPAVRQQALLQWTRFEKALSRLVVPRAELEAELADPAFVRSHSLIENHYFLNHGFIDGEKMIERVAIALARHPVQLINGRYDVVCPPITASQIHSVLPKSTLTLVPAAGHSWKQPAMLDAILAATDSIPGPGVSLDG